MTVASSTARRRERMAALISILVLCGCLALSFASCGGEDLVFPGMVVVPSGTPEDLTPTPETF